MIATCHTEGCGNAEHGIDIGQPLDPDGNPDPAPMVTCGPCGEPITDLA